jgi:DNA helicase-2/ATP-dependent DNA helicase PcrA
VSFYADLHIHSRYSRACSRNCDLEHLAWWAGRKGIAVVGTGDFTHPAWIEELRRDLVPAEPGLFRLRPDLERAVHARLPAACRAPVRFMLSSEISTIYKRDERTRKVHHLLYAPGFDEVDEITRRLTRVGNLGSDGRPILGLDSRDLLEITLSGGDGCYLVPAHAWTPWFAVLGSQSGFDDVAACYADLSDHIFAIETGLSSDPEMNWRVSSLDRYRLVSNSDAHSPPMLGREATVFGGALPDVDYHGIKRALEGAGGFGGTVEFFPEEGKYHLDGHRACGVRTSPEETRAAGGLCPVCGKKPTIGVQHRVDALADREAGYKLPGAAEFKSFVPLPEILGEIAGVGPKSKSVTAQVSAMVERFGPELGILGDVPLDELAGKAPSIAVEAIARLRRGEVRREAGYDGVYGVIRLFDPAELAGAALFDIPKARKARPRASTPASGSAVSPAAADGAAVAGSDGEPANLAPAGLDPGQQAIVDHDGGPLLVVAGPGAGKTRVLINSLGRRLRDGADPERCLAVTFTRRARDELRERLTAFAGEDADRVAVATFHGLGLLILREQCKRLGLDAGLKVADEPTRRAVLRQLSGGSGLSALAKRIAEAKRALATAAAAGAQPESDMETAALLAAYDARLRERGLVDVDDLITLPVLMLSSDASLASAYRSRWDDVYVDEYQDVDELQYRLLRLITLPDSRVCAIGDPDQAIYGFRGGDVGYFLRFAEDYPSAGRVELSRNYRSAPSIVQAALQVIRPGTLVPGRSLIPARADIPDSPVVLRACADERAEAEAVAETIERMMGGTTLLTADGRETVEHQLSFADFAVLYRTSAQAAAVADALGKRGFPCQQRSHARLAEMPGVPEILAGLRAPVLDAEPVPVADQVASAVESALADADDVAARVAIRAAADVVAPLAARCGANLDRFLDELSLGAEVDTWDPRADRVTLLTLHASKGLEFPVVFIVGCDDGLLPLQTWRDQETDYAEERRLLFVGMTRATAKLTLLTAARRTLRGETRDSVPSPFLASVDPALLERSGGRIAAAAAKRAKRSNEGQFTLF